MKNLVISVVVMTLAVSTIAGCGDSDPKPTPKGDAGFTPTEATIKEVSDSNLKELVVKLTFVDAAGVEWVAPKGALTDGASVPRVALSLIGGRFEREFLRAAIVHDAYSQSFNKTRCPDQYRTKPWQVVHRMFHEACLASGTSPTKARIMYAAVLLGGPRWDDPGRNLDQVSKDALKTEFEHCKKWIEETDPTIKDIEVRIKECERKLLGDKQ